MSPYSRTIMVLTQAVTIFQNYPGIDTTCHHIPELSWYRHNLSPYSRISWNQHNLSPYSRTILVSTKPVTKFQNYPSIDTTCHHFPELSWYRHNLSLYSRTILESTQPVTIFQNYPESTQPVNIFQNYPGIDITCHHIPELSWYQHNLSP